MNAAVEKWTQTIKVNWSKLLAYRLNFILQIIGPTVVFFFVKYSVWKSVYSSNPAQVIQGYTFDQMINYHCWVMIAGMLTQGHHAWDLAEDIRMGRISSYLIYPFQFWQFHSAGFLSFQMLQIAISLVTMVSLRMFGIISTLEPFLVFKGMSFSLAIGFFWFSLQYFTGLLAFWLDETWIIRVLLNMLAIFLSGAFIPLDFFPESLRAVLEYTPFPFLAYHPTKMFTGTASITANAVIVLVAWFLFMLILNRWIWRKGVKLYTAAGM